MERNISIKELLFVMIFAIIYTLSFLVSPIPAVGLTGLLLFVLVFYKFQEIGFFIPFFGIILLRPIFLAAGIERALLLFLLISSMAILSAFLNRKKLALPQINTALILFFLLYAMFIIGLFRSPEPAYAYEKVGIMFFYSVIPFVIMQMLHRSHDILENTHRIMILLSLYLIVASIAQYLVKGVGAYERFTIGLGPIGYARAVGIGIVVSIYSFDRERSTKWRMLSIFIFLGSIFFIIVGATRGPFLAAMATALFYIVFLSRANLSVKVGLPLVMGGMIYFFMKKGAFLFARLQSTAVGQEISANYRYILWQTALEHIWDHPVFGGGTGYFASFVPVNLKSTGLVYPHNIFLEFNIEWGVIGLSLLILLLAYTALYSLRLMKWESKRETGLNSHLAIVLFVYALMNAQISSDIAGNYLLWMSISLIAVVYIAKKRESLPNNRGFQE